MKLRTIATALTFLTAGTLIGATTQHIASADVSSGDRPVLIPIEPCRLVDTRPNNTVGPRASRVGAADTLTVDAQESGTLCTGKVPADALSLALNVTAIGATQQTFLTIWAGGTRPSSSSLNPAPGEPPTPNAVTVDLSADQEFEIYNNLGDLHLLVDVTGYYANHDHDDRYFTQDQADERFGPPATIDVSPTEFRQYNGGWIEQRYSISTTNLASGRCIYAAVTVPAGAIVASATVSYRHSAAIADLDIALIELASASQRFIAGEAIALVAMFPEQYIADFFVGTASATATDAVPAAAAAAHQLEICTATSFFEVHGVQLTLA